MMKVDNTNKEWAAASKETNNKIKLLGFINFNEGFLDYIAAGDLYLDSYPFCGGTATIDAISVGTPALTLKTPCPQFDYLTKTSAYCHSKDELVDKAKKILTDNAFANTILEELKKSLEEYQSKTTWNKKLNELFHNITKTHEIKFIKGDNICEIGDLSVLCNVLYNKDFLEKQKAEIITPSAIRKKSSENQIYRFGINNICAIVTFKTNRHMQINILLFNKKILSCKLKF